MMTVAHDATGEREADSPAFLFGGEAGVEDLVADLAGEAKAVLAFLGLPWREEVLSYHERKGLVRSPSYAQASRPVYGGSVEKWMNYMAYLAPHAAVFAGERRRLGYGEKLA